MRSLIVTAIWLSMLVPSAFAQTNSSSTNQSDRIAAAKRETADLEKARIIEQLRHNNLRMQAQQKEIEKFAQQQGDEPAPARRNEKPRPHWKRPGLSFCDVQRVVGN